MLNKFHSQCGRLVAISLNALSAQRMNATSEFTDGVVFSAWPLTINEAFTVQITDTVNAWNGSIEIGLISE